MSSFVLLFTPFYAICPPFQKAPSGNPTLQWFKMGCSSINIIVLKDILPSTNCLSNQTNKRKKYETLNLEFH